MIDLHTHLLPGIDDGSKSLEMSISMAKIAVADGIGFMACTPHIYPGLYMNDTAGIQAARDKLQVELKMRDIPLKLVVGADVHLVPGLLEGIRAGTVPTIHNTRYLLLEPSHTIAPPHFADQVFSLVGAGYVPIITHPERLHWIEGHFEVFKNLIRQGAWMQVTAGALTGMFGPRAKYWGERFLGDGLTHIIASDAHSDGRRLPVLSEARAIAERMLGAAEATHLVLTRPQAVLEDRVPSQVVPLPAVPVRKSWRHLFSKAPTSD